MSVKNTINLITVKISNPSFSTKKYKFYAFEKCHELYFSGKYHYPYSIQKCHKTIFCGNLH